MSQELHTESAIIDKVVEYFQGHRDEQHKRPGEYFDELFYVNALQKNPIEIPAKVLRPIKHLLKDQKNFHSILHRAILKFCQSWHYYPTIKNLDEEGRFNWKII